MTLSKRDIVRRLQDCLVVFDREIPEPDVRQELARAKVMSLLLDVSRDELDERVSA